MKYNHINSDVKTNIGVYWIIKLQMTVTNIDKALTMTDDEREVRPNNQFFYFSPFIKNLKPRVQFFPL